MLNRELLRDDKLAIEVRRYVDLAKKEAKIVADGQLPTIEVMVSKGRRVERVERPYHGWVLDELDKDFEQQARLMGDRMDRLSDRYNMDPMSQRFKRTELTHR